MTNILQEIDARHTGKAPFLHLKKTNLLQEIDARHTGRSSFLHLKQYILQSRCHDYYLSNQIDFEPIHRSAVNCLDGDRSGRFLLSGGKDGGLFIHDLLNFTGSPNYRCRVVEGVDPHSTHGHPQSVETVQWFPFDSGMFLSSGMDRTLRVWDANTMTPVDSYLFSGKIYQHHMSTIPTGNVPLIAVASTLNQVLLVDMKSGQFSHELRGHSSSVMCCSWSPTREYLLVTGSCDSTLRLWDTRSARSFLAVLDLQNRLPAEQQAQKRSGANPVTAHNGFINGIAFSPDGRLLLSTGTDEQLRCWDMHTLRNREVPFERVPNRRNKALNFQVFGYRNFNICFVPTEGNIIMFEVETGNTIKTLSGHYNLVNSCYFQRDRMELYSGGQDRSILLWTHVKEIKDEDSGTKVVKRERIEDDWSDDEEGQESEWTSDSESS